jgi:GTP cyclohydrolase I
MVQHLRALERVAVARVAEKPSQTEVEDAVRTMIRWAGDDTDRDGMRETPTRVARA